MEFGGQTPFLNPGAGLGLVDMARVDKGSNIGLRDVGLAESIIDVDTCDRGYIASVNVILVINDRVVYTTRVKDPPIFPD